jgi:Domain of unknown function (DUF4440)
MRSHTWVLALLLAANFSSMALGQTGNEKPDLENTLREASERWLCTGAYQQSHKDCVEFRKKYWVDRFFEIDRTGTVKTKDQLLAELSTANPLPGTGPYLDDLRLKAVYGDFAMTVDHTVFRTVDSKGQLAFTSDAKVLRLFAQEDGQWRPAASAMVPIIQPSPPLSRHENNSANSDSPDTHLEEQLAAIDQKWMAPTSRPQDKIDYLQQLFTDSWYEILGWNPTAPETKSALLSSIAKPKSRPGLGVFSDEFKLMAVYGNVALATDRRTRKSLDSNGQIISTPYRSLLVFVNENGRWRSAGGAVVPIMQP